MTACTVLDAEAVTALLDRSHPARRQVRAALTASHRLRRPVLVATVTLAELYRGRDRTAALDALLAAEQPPLQCRDTDRRLARLVGALLRDAGMGSEHLADAHAIGVCVESGGGMVLTGDTGDLDRIAGAYANVVVVALHDSR